MSILHEFLAPHSKAVLQSSGKDLRSLAKNWTWLTLSGILQQAISFVTLLVIGRGLAPLGYGLYEYIMASVALIQTFSTLGMKQIIIRTVARKPTELQFIARSLFPTQLVVSVICAFILVIYLRAADGIFDLVLLTAVVVIVVSQALWHFVEALAFGTQKMELSSSLGVAGAMIWLILLGMLPSTWMLVPAVLTTFAIAQLARVSIYVTVECQLGYFRKPVEMNLGPSVLIRRMSREGLPLLGTSLLSIPVTQLPVMFLGSYSGMESVGYFGIGNRLISPMTLVSSTFLTALYPVLAEQFATDRERMRRTASQFLLVLSILGISLALAVSLFGHEIVLLLFGQQYANSVPCFSIQVWTSLNLIIHGFMGVIFVASNNERKMALLSLFNALIVGFSSYFTAKHGPVALSLGMWLSLFIGLFVNGYFFSKELDLKMVRSKVLISLGFFSILSVLTFGLSQAILLTRVIMFFVSASMIFAVYRTFFLQDLPQLVMKGFLNPVRKETHKDKSQ